MAGNNNKFKLEKCARKGCGKCLYCYKHISECICTEEQKSAPPKDVLYGWCTKCRQSHKTMYKRVEGSNCTYCGGDIEDNFSSCGLAAAILLFPIGIIICCCTKERKCVICHKVIV